MDTAIEPDPSFDLESEFQRFARAGDIGALARVFDATAPGLLSVARHLCRDNAAAEDLVQQTFVTAIERARTYDAARSLLAWLTGILALHARKHARVTSRTPDPERVASRSSEDPHRAAQGAEIAAAVERAVGALPERYATVLRLHLREQLVPREIARRIGVEPGTARVQLHRGLKMLRDALPAGLGGFAAAPLAGGDVGGLASVREAVLARATRLGASPVATAVGTTSTVLLWSAAAVLAVGIAGGMIALSGGSRDAEEVANAASSPETPSARSVASAGTEAPVDALAAGARTSAIETVTVAAPARDPRTARVEGRLRLPDGSPAIGVELALHGWKANAERVAEFPPPDDWQDPPAVRTGSDGRFEIDVVPPRAFQFTLDARLAGFAAMSWRWVDIAEASRVDVGECTFEPACTVIVRVLGRDGAPLAVPFEVSGSNDAGGFASMNDAREPVRVNARRDAALGVYVLDGLPPGACEISARAATADPIPARSVVADPLEPTLVDLVYTGADPTRRIVVSCGTSPFHTMRADLARVRLVGASGPVAQSPSRPTHSSSVSFDDLAPGSYTVEVDDPRFETFVRAGVQPGERVRATLRGSAALRVVLRLDGAPLDVEPERLSLVYDDPNRRPNEFDLGDRERLRRVDGYVTGIVPGTCELRVRVAGFPATTAVLGAIAPGERREVVVDLERGRTLRGVARTGEAPAAGATVLLSRGDVAAHGLARGSSVFSGGKRLDDAACRTKTGADGAFELPALQRGRYTLRIAWNEYLFVDRAIDVGDEDPEPVEVVAPPHGSLDVELRVPDGAVNDGLGIALNADRAFLSFFDQIELVAGGVTPIDLLPAGPHRVALWMRSGDSSTGCQQLDALVVAGARTSLSIDTRDSLHGRVEVRVLVDGVVRRGVQFGIRRTDGTEVREHTIEVRRQADTSIAVVPPGRYELVLGGRDDSWSWTAPRVIDVAAGRQLEVDVDLPLVDRTLALVDAAGSAAKEHDVALAPLDAPGSAPWTARTDALGRATVALLAGRYRLRVDGVDREVLTLDRATPEPLRVVVAAR